MPALGSRRGRNFLLVLPGRHGWRLPPRLGDPHRRRVVSLAQRTGVQTAPVEGGDCPLQRGGQVRSMVGEPGQSLVQIAVGGGGTEISLSRASWANRVPSTNHRRARTPCLTTTRARGVLAGAEPVAVLAPKPVPEPRWSPADIERGGVGDAGQRVKPLAVRNLIFADLFLQGLHPYLMPGHLARSRIDATTSRIATVTL